MPARFTPFATAVGWAHLYPCLRGVPDIAFFLFFVIADQALNTCAHKVKLPRLRDQRSVRAVTSWFCQAAKMPLGIRAMGHEAYGFPSPLLTFAIVFGAFAANCALWCDARRAAGADRNRRSLRHVAPLQTFLAYPCATDVVLLRCPGLAICWMVLDQGEPAACSCGHRRPSCTGA